MTGGKVDVLLTHLRGCQERYSAGSVERALFAGVETLAMAALSAEMERKAQLRAEILRRIEAARDHEFCEDERSRQAYNTGIDAALSTARAALSDAPAPASEGLAWAVERWKIQVANRPLRNIHRRGLDDTWRQVIRYFGGDPVALIGPAHDDLVAAPAAEYPSGVTVSDHIAHDMRQGRFPQQSSIATFLAERGAPDTPAPASGTGTRVEGLEEAARWHDHEAVKRKQLRDNWARGSEEYRHMNAAWMKHRFFALQIRALATSKVPTDE